MFFVWGGGGGGGGGEKRQEDLDYLSITASQSIGCEYNLISIWGGGGGGGEFKWLNPPFQAH